MDDVAVSADPRSRDLRDRIEDARTGVRREREPASPTRTTERMHSDHRNIVIGGVIDRIGIRSVTGNWENARSDVTYAFTLTENPRRVHVMKSTTTPDALALARSGDEVQFEIRRDCAIVNFQNKSIG